MEGEPGGRVPLLGQATPILQAFVDASLDGKRYKATAGQSAATSLQTQLLNMSSDAVAAPGELLRGDTPRVITGLDRLSVTMVPGFGALRRAMGDDSLDRVPGGVSGSHQQYRQAVDYTKFREKVAGQPEFREDPDGLFDIDDLIKQLEDAEKDLKPQASADREKILRRAGILPDRPNTLTGRRKGEELA